jgi:hypothetical protein
VNRQVNNVRLFSLSEISPFFLCKAKKNFLSIFFRRKFAHKSDWSAVKSTCPSEFFFFAKTEVEESSRAKTHLVDWFSIKKLNRFCRGKNIGYFGAFQQTLVIESNTDFNVDVLSCRLSIHRISIKNNFDITMPIIKQYSFGLINSFNTKMGLFFTKIK